MTTSASIFDQGINQWQKEMDLPWGKLKYKLVQANLAKHLGNEKLKILDVGGGNGLDSIPLAGQGHHVDIVDYSKEMLADAKRHAEKIGAGERVAMHHTDISAIPDLFPGTHFDLMLCHNIIQYIDDVPQFLKKLAVCLRVGGLISIVSINRYSIPYHSAFLRGDLEEAFAQLDVRSIKANIFDASMTNFSVGEVGEMLVGTGYKVEQDYGVRCICDYWGSNELKADPEIFEQIERLEFALTERHPYKLLARYFQIVARKG